MIKVYLSQINPTVGDLKNNLHTILQQIEYAVTTKSDLIAFPEFALTGYPIDDLVENADFLLQLDQIISELLLKTKDYSIRVLLSTPYKNMDKLYNGVLVLYEGKIVRKIPKIHLPNYSVFDEKRYFSKGTFSMPLEINNIKIGIMTCEDIWHKDVTEHLVKNGANFLLVLNASPFDISKKSLRLKQAKSRITEHNKPLIYLNMVGGQDELVFDGRSFIATTDNKIHYMKSWAEDSAIIQATKNTLEIDEGSLELHTDHDELGEIYQAMMLGLKDYVKKNGFGSVLLGLSGGIDSALTAVVAADALGADKVLGIRLPSIYSSQHSLDDASDLQKNTGFQMNTISIEDSYNSLYSSLSDIFGERPQDITEENIQARIRGLILMAISNKFKSLLLTTGNKSEVAVGYSTLYGDMCGGFSVLKDIYKTTVFKLSKWRNGNIPKDSKVAKKNIIPTNILIKEPSAELRNDQKDSDSLPDYEVLDDILKNLIEKHSDLTSIALKEYDMSLIKKINNLLFRSEFKRMQSAPGVKITQVNLSRDRRYPITNNFIL